MPPIEVRALTRKDWPAYEKLFGGNGACGGCWCMWWRRPDDERWEDLKGADAKRRMKALIASGKAMGALAFAGGEPIGWCSYGPRLDYPRLDGARSLKCNDASEVWSIPCFFIRKDWRGKGVATQLLQFVLRELRAKGARIAEGYPVKPTRSGAPLPSAFAWTGTRSMFDACGFEIAGNPGAAKQRVRRRLR